MTKLKFAVVLSVLLGLAAPASADNTLFFSNRTHVERPVPPEAFAILAMHAGSAKVAAAQCDLYVNLSEPGGGHGILGRIFIEGKAHKSCMTLKGF